MQDGELTWRDACGLIGVTAIVIALMFAPF